MRRIKWTAIALVTPLLVIGLASDLSLTWPAMYFLLQQVPRSEPALVSVALAEDDGRAPVADAGFDRAADVDDLVVLDGSRSISPAGVRLSYRWTVVRKPSGGRAVLDDARAIKPRLTIEGPGDYIVRLLVSDGTLTSAPDYVTISTENVAPVAHPGRDRLVSLGEEVLLDGSASTDLDGDEISYNWALVKKPAGSGAVLDDPGALWPAFIVDTAGTYVAELRVSDSTLTSAPAWVVFSTDKVAPVAVAGRSTTATTGAGLRFEPNGTSGGDDAWLAAVWSLIGTPQDSIAELSAAPGGRPELILDEPGTYVVQLELQDGASRRAYDTLAISTANTSPLADAGPDQAIEEQSTIWLDGAGSSDVDGDQLTYSWALIHAPVGSRAMLDDPAAVRPAFFADLPGTYVAQLIVDDGAEPSRPDTVILTTEGVAPVAVAAADRIEGAGMVRLDGTGSWDADGDPLTYSWSAQIVGSEPDDAAFPVFSDPETSSPVLDVGAGHAAIVQLVIDDGLLESPPESTFISPDNSPPVADAGEDHQVGAGARVELSGAGSFDADRDRLTYRWSLLAKPAASSAHIFDEVKVRAGFVADAYGTYVAQLIVNDGVLSSRPDTVAIEVPEPVAPVRSDVITLTVNDVDEDSSPPAGTVVAAINAGGGAYTALDGTAYSADAFFSGGKKNSTTAAIAGTEDDSLYKSERWIKGTLSYDVPVPEAGDYLVTLQFAEIHFTSPGQRAIDIALEGVEQVSNLDLVRQVGANTAFDVTLPVTVTDGTLDIDMTADVNNPKLSAVRIVASDGSGGEPQPPTDIQVSATSFNEESTFSATLTAVDPDSTEFTFSLLNDPSGQFQVQGNQLSLLQPIDFENLPAGFVQQNGTATVDLPLQVEDESANTFSETVTLTVNDVDEGGQSQPVTLVAAAGVLDGFSAPQQWSEDVTIFALAPNGSAAVITHTTSGFGVAGGRFDAQIDHIPSNNTSERFVLEFNGSVTDVILQLARMNPSERGGQRETGTWTAFDDIGTEIASGVLDPANGTQAGSQIYNIAIDASGQSFSKLVIKATGYNGGTAGSGSESSDFALKQLTYTPAGAQPSGETAPPPAPPPPSEFQDDTFCEDCPGPRIDITNTDFGYTRSQFSGDDGTVWDARGSTWIFNNSKNPHPTDAQRCTEGTDPINTLPIHVLSTPNGRWQGGVIDGLVPLDSQFNPTYCNAVGMRVKNSPGFVTEGIRMDRVWDGAKNVQGSQDYLVKDVWISRARDDCLEGTSLHSGVVRDSLFDGCFAGFDSDPGNSYDGPSREFTELLQYHGVLLRMQPFWYQDKWTHAHMFKTHDASPSISLHNSILAPSIHQKAYGRTARAWQRMTNGKGSCSNNLLLWLGEGGLPSDFPTPPPCFTVVTGPEARQIWQEAKQNWINCHPQVGRISAGLDPASDPSQCVKGTWGGYD